jgi:hypothetical protein
LIRFVPRFLKSLYWIILIYIKIGGKLFRVSLLSVISRGDGICGSSGDDDGDGGGDGGGGGGGDGGGGGGGSSGGMSEQTHYLQPVVPLQKASLPLP